jgi:hypothetical protein
MSGKSGREQLVYTLSPKKFWLSSDLELEWETKQEMPRNSDFERSIYFSQTIGKS